MNEPAKDYGPDRRRPTFDAADVERTRLKRRVRELEEELAYRQREDSRKDEQIADLSSKCDRFADLCKRLGERLIEGKPPQRGDPMTRAEVMAELEAISRKVLPFERP